MTDEQVMAFIKNGVLVRIDEVATHFAKPYTTVYNRLEALRRAGWLERKLDPTPTGGRPKSLYKVTSKWLATIADLPRASS